MNTEIEKLLDKLDKRGIVCGFGGSQHVRLAPSERDGLIAALRRALEFGEKTCNTMEESRPFAMTTVETEWHICERDIAAILKGSK